MSAAHHCAVMRNPFSTAVAAARMPDGVPTLSTSSRYSASREATDIAGDCKILLYPGFYSGLATINTPAGETVPASAHYFFDIPSRGTVHTDAVTTGGETKLKHSTAVPQQYRIVSQGLRLSLINNSLDNDGWFEAIRVSPGDSTHDYLMFNATTPANNVSVKIVANPGTIENALLMTTDWSMHASYISGKLRDIHKYTFMLHRDDDGSFIDIDEEPELVSAGTGTGANNVIGIRRNAGQANWFIDRNMDMVMIRAHCTASATAPLKLHLHVMQHVEECFEAGSDLYRFMSAPPVNRTLVQNVLRAIKSDIKPAMVRSPTAPVSVVARRGVMRRRRSVRGRRTFRNRRYRRRR